MVKTPALVAQTMGEAILQTRICALLPAGFLTFHF